MVQLYHKLSWIFLLIILSFSTVKAQNWTYVLPPLSSSIVLNQTITNGTYSINYASIVPTSLNCQQVQFLLYMVVGSCADSVFTLTLQNVGGNSFVHYALGHGYGQNSKAFNS